MLSTLENESGAAPAPVPATVAAESASPAESQQRQELEQEQQDALPTPISRTWNVLDLAQWVPLRLTSDERALLTVLEQTLHVSEYTDQVDVTIASGHTFGNNAYQRYKALNGVLPQNQSSNAKTTKILKGICEICHIATGLAAASVQERKFIDLCNRSIKQQQPKKAGNGGNDDSSSAAAASIGGGISLRIPSMINRKKGVNKMSKEQRKLEKEQKKIDKRLRKQQQMKKKKKMGDTDTADSSPLTGVGNGDGTDDDTSREGSRIVVPTKLKSGPLAGNKLHENAIFFQTLFEIGRRNKVLNPSSMRTTYGKLMYMLQDAQNPVVAKALGFSLHKDIVTIGPYLEQNNCSQLLSDPRLDCAIQYISDRDERTGIKFDRSTIQALVNGKQRVMEELVIKYSTDTSNTLTEADVRRVIESLADAVVYIESAVRPARQMLQYLHDNFHPVTEKMPGKISNYTNLSLRGTKERKKGPTGGGLAQPRHYGLSAYTHGDNERPTLSHVHTEQFTFVEQSLKLWTKVMRHMHQLWICADDDLLSTTSTYHLYNTGQGLNRVQGCPRVRDVMSRLLGQTQSETGKNWVGLSVIHLGDRDVPNALIFIDKYTQIPRFLNPIVNFIQSIPSLMKDPKIAYYINDLYGTTDNLILAVLQDYYKHGFDGSGDDGGSCIDGRITSSWNWTSRIAKKDYYYAFMLSGFQGFDGDFR